MRSLTRLLLALVLLLALGLPTLTGCEEAARCEEACQHACALCGGTCPPDDPNLLKCQESCRNQDIPPERVDCLIETQSCDELWRC